VTTDFVQQPSTLWVPPRLGSYGPEIIDFNDGIGIQMDATQRRDIDCLSSYGPMGRWLTLETCIIEGRQNGKTKSVILPITMADLFLFSHEPDLIVWTSHLVRTSLDTFKRVKQLIEANSILSSRVKEIRESKAEQEVELMDGSVLGFFARGGGGGRGFGGKRVVFDEALFLKAEPMGSFIPTLSARDNPQISYAASAEKGDGDHLRALRRRGARLSDPSLIMIDYKAPGGWDNPGCREGIQCTHLFGVTGCSLDNEDYWRMANHAINAGRIRIEFVRAERRALGETLDGVLEFGRERMGWGELGGASLDPDRIPLQAWTAQADPASAPVGEVCFSVDMPPSGMSVSIGVGGRRADGNIHFGVVHYQRGTAGAVKRLAKLQEKHETFCAPIWWPEGPVNALAPEIRDSELSMTALTTREVSEACGSFKRHIIAGTAYHQGTEVLDTAFRSAERRVSSEGAWVWGRRKSGSDISPVYGGTFCVYGVDTYSGSEPGVWSF
jgi:hypothetical protein